LSGSNRILRGQPLAKGTTEIQGRKEGQGEKEIVRESGLNPWGKGGHLHGLGK